MGNVPRRHHYVPQVLLSGFTDSGTNDGTLHIVDLVRRRTYPSTPRETAAEKDYNLIEIEGFDPFTIESELLAEKIEGPAGPGLKAVRRGEMPSEDDRGQLLAFIAMQALRAPSRREAFDEFTTQAARQMMALITNSDEMFEAHRERFPELASISREEAREWGKNIRMRHSPTGHLQTQLPSFGPIFDLLMMRSWTILAAPGASDFVCSDDPVVHLPAGTRPVDAPRGFGSEDAPVLMAVGRKHALLGTWPVEGDAPAWNSTDVDTKCVALMNWCVLFRARRFVASPSDDFVWRRGDGTIANRAALLELLVEAPRDPG